jgi:CheY-like chemotaxis protein
VTSKAKEGIKIADEKLPSLIFMDINLPGMDGITALNILKLMPSLKNTKMFALSADAYSEQIEKVLSAGIDEYLTKPVSLDQIARIIGIK